MTQTLQHIDWYLARNAREQPAKLALVQDDVQLTWQELERLVAATSDQLATELSSEPQQVVAMLLPNSWRFVVAYLALLRCGHIALPLDPTYKQLEINGILEQITPSLSITDAGKARYFAGQPVVLVEDLIDPSKKAGPLLASGETTERPLPANRQVASLLFTSGTTGKPKITQYSHANHMWNITAVSELWRWTSDDTLLLSLPLSHWHGLVMGLDGGLYHANTMYLHERFDPEATLRTLSEGGISLFMHVPIAYSRMTAVQNPERFDIGRVRLCVSGSSYLPPAVWHDFERLFGQAILERYGASEMGLLTSNPLDDRQPGSVGMPLKDVELRVTESGELAMRSPGLFPGYYRNPEATAKNFTPDGMWLTGDIGELADDGRIKLKGRVIEKLKKLGYTIYPRDVEWAVHQMPGVDEVALVGIQDEAQLSDTLVFFIRGSVNEQAVLDYCKANMPAAWRPDKVIFLEEIPKTRSGKPVRAALLEMAHEQA